jgi:hypothetical protein
MTIDTTIPQFLDVDCPLTPARLAALSAQGIEVGHMRYDTRTGELYTNTGPGGAYERAPGWVREQIADSLCYDPDEIDLLIPAAALRDPILKALHDTKVRDKLIHLTELHRPDLRSHPGLSVGAEFVVGTLSNYQQHYAKLPDANARWALFAGAFFEWLEGLPRESGRKARG